MVVGVAAAAVVVKVVVVAAVRMPEVKRDPDDKERNESGGETGTGIRYPPDLPMPHANRRAGNKKKEKEKERV